MRVVLLSICVIVLEACSNAPKQEILVPTLTSGFYSDALDQINGKLDSDPTNIYLVEQKLFYCEQLSWPETCISALDHYKSTYGMTTQLADQYIEYYERNERYQLLLDLIDRWNEEFDLKERFQRPLIKSLVKTNQKIRSKRELEVFLIENNGEDALDFAIRQYLSLGDTLMAVYHMSKLQKINDQNMLMFDYGKLLVEIGFESKGFSVLESYLSRTSSADQSMEVAYLYESSGQLAPARKLLKPYINQDTIAFLLSSWYKQDLLWDSAIMYIDSVLVDDTTNTKALWKKGRLYEDRSWLSSSLEYFEEITQIDPDDTLAVDKVQEIRRKIAYLQRQKFEESKVPVLELESIKIKN